MIVLGLVCLCTCDDYELVKGNWRKRTSMLGQDTMLITVRKLDDNKAVLLW